MTIPPIVSLERFRKQLNAALAAGGAVVGTTSISPSGDTSGATDTAAIQAAITSGDNVQLAPGVFYTNATLTATSYDNCGQTIRGSGSFYSTGSFGFSYSAAKSATIIRPTSAVTTAILIDGTPVSGYQLSWVQGFGIENICFDMQNMTDVATTSAINQIQAWDCHYNQVRVIYDGTNKCGWLFKAGAFTTTIRDSQCNILEFTGDNPGYGVTTITVINHDGGSVVARYFVNARFLGGAFQGSGPKFTMQDCEQIHIASDIEGTGTYLNIIGTTTYDVYSSVTLGGFSGTYLSGVINGSFFSWDSPVLTFSYPALLTRGQIQLNNQGAAGYSLFQSGALGQNYFIGLGRTATDGLFGLAATANDFNGATGVGDVVLQTQTAGTSVWIGGFQTGTLKVSQTGARINGTLANTTAGGTINVSTVNATLANITGNANINTLVAKPTVDGTLVAFENSAGTAFMVANSNATIGASTVGVGWGANWTGYSDNYTTLTYNFDAATGNATFSGTVSVGGAFVSSSPTAGIGYSTGAGGTVTQATSRTTTVILNKTVGAITLFNAAGQATYQTFTVTNSTVAATDVIHLSQKSGTDKQILLVTAVAAGLFQITFATTGGTTVEQPVINFAVIKGVTS